jgi:hypothetical protein
MRGPTLSFIPCTTFANVRAGLDFELLDQAPQLRGSLDQLL